MDNSQELSKEEAKLIASIDEPSSPVSQIGELNHNIAAVKELGEAALQSWSEHHERKTENERREMEIEEKIHARNTNLAIVVIVAFMVIVLAAMWLGESGTADKIIDSLFKFLAGAGVVGYFVRRNQNNSK
ncbi:hypothetical protein [Vibrio fluvialis]|uniref:hypothetical protein n=1 Tax=Vibrio fluvialis TaxID=676 RepID=UPI003D7D427F